MAKRQDNPNDPLPDPPPPKPKPVPKPKGTGNPKDPTTRDIFSLASENGIPVPLVYGMSRVTCNLLERDNTQLAPVNTIPLYLPAHNYTIGPPADQAVSNNNVYEAIQTGVSSVLNVVGSGPSGTDDNIPDGTMRWKYVKPNDTKAIAAPNAFAWKPTTAYVVNAIVQSNGNAYACITAGTSAAGTIGYGISGTNADIVDGTVHWMYVKGGFRSFVTFGICEGAITGLLHAYSDNFVGHYSGLPHDGSQFALFLGAPGGLTRPTWSPTGFTENYDNTAVLMLQMTTGPSNNIGNVSVEAQGIFYGNTAAPDASGADIIADLLTHSRRGLGALWPVARLDTAGSLAGGVTGSYRDYCTAYGLNLSWSIEAQTTVMDLLGQLLDATNSDAYMTNRLDGLGMMLKFVPRGDAALTANGVTFTPVLATVFNVGPDDFQSPVQIVRQPAIDTFNSCPVEYVDRASGYTRFTVDDPEMADVDKRGLRRTDALALSQVISPDAAVMLARLRAQRSLYRPNQYTFELSEKYMLLEPSDLGTITLPISGVTKPVRVLTVEEQESGKSFTIVAEDWPAAVATAASFTPQVNDGFRPQQLRELSAVVVQPQQVTTTTVAEAGTTRGAAVSSLWPNHNSEGAPPDGATTLSPEWVGRVNAGAGAFSGNWVREISMVANGPLTFLGDKPNGTTAITASTVLGFKVKAAPGDLFVIEAQVRGTAKATGGTPRNQASIGWFALDVNDNIVNTSGMSNSFDFTIPAVPTAYQALSTRPAVTGNTAAPCPAGTTAVYFYIRLIADGAGTTGTATAQFDSINAYRVTDSETDIQTNSVSMNTGTGLGVFVVLAGTTNYTVVTTTRKTKVTLTFSGFITGAAGQLKVGLQLAGVTTGLIYNIFYNTVAQHQSWSFQWVLPAGAAGLFGTTVALGAVIQSPVGSPANFNQDVNDSVTLVAEEVG